MQIRLQRSLHKRDDPQLAVAEVDLPAGSHASNRGLLDDFRVSLRQLRTGPSAAGP